MTIEEFKIEFKMNNDGDSWGTCMIAFFDLAARLHIRGVDMPREWEYKPSPLLSEDSEEDDDDQAEEDRLELLESNLSVHFVDKPVREAFVDAQSSLSESRRYRRLAKITGPWPADVYLSPAEVSEA